MWWNVSNPYRSFGKRASKEKHCGVGRKTILTVRLKFGQIRIVEVKRYHSKPGRPSVMDPAWHPHSGPGWWKSGSLGVPSRARSAFCDAPELRHRRTSPRPARRFCHRKCRGRFCHRMKKQNCHVTDRQTMQLIYKILIICTPPFSLPTAKNATNQVVLPLSISLSPTHTMRAHKESWETASGRNGAMVGDKSEGECQFLCFYNAL